MRVSDYGRLGLSSLRGSRLRSFLSLLGVAVGVAAVVLLTSIGEGARRHVVREFSQFGTNVLEVAPGKTETAGIPGVFGGTTHKLTIEDAEALRRVPGVTGVVPLAFGQARVEAQGRGRSVYVFGANSELPQVWSFAVGQGGFLPPGDPRQGAAVAVLGPKLKTELFGTGNALGELVRVAGMRLRVIGVMQPKGQMLGWDMDDAAYVPVATALRLFNREELWEIDVSFRHEQLAGPVVDGIREVLARRHGGKEDFTITTMSAMLETFGKVMGVITLAVSGIAGISLLVGGIGVLTVMWIAVGERVEEIGLMRALGATQGQVRRLFLLESGLLGLAGGALGTAAGLGAVAAGRVLVPGLPLGPSNLYLNLYLNPYLWAALAVSLGTGLAAGILPAARAATLDPIQALRAE